MPTLPDWGFCGPSDQEASLVLDAQRSQNLFPVPGAPGAKSKMALYGRPGLSSTVLWTLAGTPVRLLWAGNSRVFAVGGANFYELAGGGGVLTNYGAMAGSAGTGPCQAIANGTQLLVMDLSAKQVYNANTVGPAMNSVFNGVALEYLDGFYIAIATGASLAGSNPNQINVSALGDGTTWNALNFVLRTGAADLTTQLAVLNGQLWIFGQKTIEVWYNAGNPLFPFARIPGATINLGLLATFSVVKFSNTLLWLGADDRGYAQVYMSNGLQPVRVSTAAIEQLLFAFLNGGANLSLSWAYGYQENGHIFYVLNFVNDASYVPVGTIVYDLTTKMWHERSYAGPYPVCFASTSGPSNLVGDGKSGKVYFQGTNYPSDAGTAIVYSRTSPHVANSNRWLKHTWLEISADVGTAQIALDISNDGGKTFPAALSRAAISASNNQGTTGGFGRFKWWQLGRSRDRVYRATIQSSTQLIRIIDGYLNVMPGTET